MWRESYWAICRAVWGALREYLRYNFWDVDRLSRVFKSTKSILTLLGKPQVTEAGSFRQNSLHWIVLCGAFRSIQVVEIGHMQTPVELKAAEYKALCLFLETHPNLMSLRLHVRRREDPGMSELFLAMSRNRNSSLNVFFFIKLIRFNYRTSQFLSIRFQSDSPNLLRRRKH